MIGRARRIEGGSRKFEVKDYVKERLGHRSLDSTLIYTHLVGFEADEYHHATSKTVKEACELIDAGFEYVTAQDGIKLWRKRK